MGGFIRCTNWEEKGVCVEESRGQECTDSEGEQRGTPILTY